MMQITRICIEIKAWKRNNSNRIKLTNLIPNNSQRNSLTSCALGVSFRWLVVSLQDDLLKAIRWTKKENKTKRELREDSVQHLPSSKLMAKKIKSVEWLCFKCSPAIVIVDSGINEWKRALGHPGEWVRPAADHPPARSLNSSAHPKLFICASFGVTDCNSDSQTKSTWLLSWLIFYVSKF